MRIDTNIPMTQLALTFLFALGALHINADQLAGAAAMQESTQLDTAQPGDSDSDGIADGTDNCTLVANADQIDADMDGFGNRCDADFDNDCQVNVVDLGILRSVFFSDDDRVDLNSDGVVNAVDLGLFRALFFSAPGPSGVPSICDPVLETATLSLLTSNTQIPSDGSKTITLTAYLSSADDLPLADQLVEFHFDASGSPSQQSITDSFGRASAQLSVGGNPMNRTIAATATAGTSLSAQVLVQVTGTSLEIVGPGFLTQGQSGLYTVELADSGGAGIANEVITLSSSTGNVLTPSQVITGATGTAQVALTAVNEGIDSLEAAALGQVAANTVRVSADTFEFLLPNSNTEIALNVARNVSVRWLRSGQPVVNQQVLFSASNGAVSPSFVLTDQTGIAVTSITGDRTGLAEILAMGTNVVADRLPVEFVAQTPESITISADVATVLAGGQSTIAVTLRDISGNVVKNENVVFTLSDATAGALSATSVVTDSRGQSQVVFTASSPHESNSTVTVLATVEANPLLINSVDLVLPEREVLLTFGTDNVIGQPNVALRSRLFTVRATDGDGSSLEGAEVTLSVTSTRYLKGFYWPSSEDDQWVRFARGRCVDEDVNLNGVLDPGEDANGNFRIDAGFIATVIPGRLNLDSAGEGFAVVRYPTTFGGWLEVELRAMTSADGIEYVGLERFFLEVLADDVDDIDMSAPGIQISLVDLDNADIPGSVLTAIDEGDGRVFTSPFGFNAYCSAWEFPD